MGSFKWKREPNNTVGIYESDEFIVPIIKCDLS